MAVNRLINGEPRSFWDVDQYRRVIKRIENGYRSCDNFLTMVQERAEIEVRYAKSVRKWTEKWSGILDKGSECGSTLEAWRACLQEGAIVAQVHEDCKMKILGEDGPFYNMYKWKKEHYHKGAFGSLQEARQANDGFAAAQKEYARLLTKSERAKKAYHSACVSTHKARLFAEEETHEDSVRPEFRRKLQQRATKLAAQQEKIKQLYLKRVLKCNGPAKDRYVQEMTGEITKWQFLERARLDTVHAQLILFVRSLDCGSPYKGAGFEHLVDLYRRLEENISQADSLRDVQDWDSRYGTGCEQHWPVFEEMAVEELDAVAYAEVERKTSFGNAIMQRRRQRPHRRRSQQTMYSSATDFDEDDDFSSDSFDSTSTEAESVTHDQEPARNDRTHSQDTVHRSQEQAVPGPYPGGHPSTQYFQQQSSQPYDHHVVELSKQYSSQIHQQSNPADLQTIRQSRHHVGKAKHGYSTPRRGTSDHKSTGHRRRSEHSQHQQHDQQRYGHKQLYTSSPRSTADHAKEWHSNHKWQPVPYEPSHGSTTPPTRDVEIPTQNIATPQTKIPAVGNYQPKISEQMLSTSDHLGMPAQHAQAPHSTQYLAGQQGTTSRYSTQPSGTQPSIDKSRQTVTPQRPGLYVSGPSYQQTTPHSQQMTPVQSWRQLQSSSGAAAFNVSGHSPSTPALQQHVTTRPQIIAGSATSAWQQHTTTTPQTTSAWQQYTTTTPQSTGSSTAAWQQQLLTTTPQSAGSVTTAWQQPSTTTPNTAPSTSSSQRHERHTTLDQAKQLLQLEDGEFMVRALYDFKASTRDEIPLKRGEVLVQKGKHSENGWAYGRNLEKTGIFPASYVQVVR